MVIIPSFTNINISTFNSHARSACIKLLTHPAKIPEYYQIILIKYNKALSPFIVLPQTLKKKKKSLDALASIQIPFGD